MTLAGLEKPYYLEYSRNLLNMGFRSLINHVSGSILAYSPSSSRELRKLFWKEYCTKDLELPFLHQIVLGIPSGNLEKQLQATGTDVDAQDALGYTAITWAGTSLIHP